MQQAASVDQNPIPWRSISTNWQNVRQPWLRPSPFNVAGIMPHPKSAPDRVRGVRWFPCKLGHNRDGGAWQQRVYSEI